jgi:ATP-dependent RNA helicase SUPV3L1/SUV3
LKMDIINNSLDLKNPHNWFPEARQIKREIIYHMGPTNSGKTDECLNELSKSQNGIYCAPLRLLAWEVIINIKLDP